MPDFVYDGFIGLAGVDGGLAPNLTPSTVSRYAVNSIFRGGVIGPRPGFLKRTLSFRGNAFVEDGFKNGTFQCAKTYYSDANVPTLIVSKGGRIFTIDPDGYEVDEVTVSVGTDGTVDWVVPAAGVTQSVTVSSTSMFTVGETVILQTLDGAAYGSYVVIAITSATTMDIQNDGDANTGDTYPAGFTVRSYDTNATGTFQSWMEQAEKWMVIQDGISKPLFYDGTMLRRAIEGEIRTGTCMAYGNGRLWVGHPSGRFYFAGDLVYGSSGSLPSRRDAVLKMTENTFLAGGGYFSVPPAAGPIRAMSFPAQLDTGLGHGPLMVFCENMVFSCDSPTIRAQWFTVEQPLRTVALRQFGGMGPWCAVTVNSDIWFRSRDGIRSLILARRDFQGAASWSNTPQSAQMDPILQVDSESLLRNASGVNLDRRLLMTTAPVQTKRGIVFKGIVSLDFDPVASISAIATKQDSGPQYDGVWTGLYTYQLVDATVGRVDRVFAFCENGDGECEVYEISRKDRFDDNGSSTPMRILWSFETGSFIFPTETTNPFTPKVLVGGEVYLADIYGDLSVDVKYRPDGYACWVNWHRWNECAPLQDCVQEDFSSCPTIADTKPQVRPYAGLPQPPNACDPATKVSLNRFFRLQVRFQFRGYANVVQARLGAIVQDQAPFAPIVCNNPTAATLQ